MKEEKVSFTVEKIAIEPNKKGPKLLRVFIRSGGKQYIKVCKKVDYLDEGTRLGLYKLWMESIKAEVEEDSKNEGKLKKDTKALEDLVGTVFEDEED